MWTRETDRYLSYLLRLWQERQGETTVWRASLESAQTHDLLHFATVSELVAYLVEITEPPDSKPPD